MLLNIHNRTYNKGRASSPRPASLDAAAAACVAQRGRSSGRRKRGRGEYRYNRATFWRAWSYCWYLHLVSVVVGRARIFGCDALTIVAHSVYFLTQRRVLVDARVELAVGDANILFVRLKVGKMLVEECAALQNSLHVLVIVLQKDVGTKTTNVTNLRAVRAFATLEERLDVDADGLQALARVDESIELFEAAVLVVRIVRVLKADVFVSVRALASRSHTR